MKLETRSLDDAVVDALAQEASVAPRTIVRRIAGLPVRGLACQRADRVLRAHGLLRSDSTPPRAA